MNNFKLALEGPHGYSCRDGLETGRRGFDVRGCTSEDTTSVHNLHVSWGRENRWGPRRPQHSRSWLHRQCRRRSDMLTRKHRVWHSVLPKEITELPGAQSASVLKIPSCSQGCGGRKHKQKRHVLLRDRRLCTATSVHSVFF